MKSKILILLVCATMLFANFSVSASPPGEPKTKSEISKQSLVVVDVAKNLCIEKKVLVDQVLSSEVFSNVLQVEAITTQEEKKSGITTKQRRLIFYAKYVLKLPDIYDRTKKNQIKLITYRS